MTSWDERLPAWQRQLNATCENWIFAFLVAFALRHFAVEAFQIPTASMEPMLYGDPGFLKRDFVVVDKVTPRFTGYHRYDPTVFQFPLPEIESGGDDARPAVDALGNRLDVPMWQPQFNRNFVKRALVLPGERFYFQGGDLFIAQADGSWAVPPKPDAVQEALWDDIYIAGAQPGYSAWVQAGAPLEDPRDLDLAKGPVRFTQPLRNLYLKPGKARVKALGSREPDQIVPVAMTAPQFTWQGRTGSLWDLEAWDVARMTSKDLDSQSHGTSLNGKMVEWVGDARFHLATTTVTGAPELVGRYRSSGGVPALTWRLLLASSELVIEEQGLPPVTRPVPGGLTGEIAVGRCDQRLLVRVGGIPVLDIPVRTVDANLHRLELAVEGGGRLACSQLRIQRDLHYCRAGALLDDPQADQADANIERTVLDIRLDPASRDRGIRELKLGASTRAMFLGKSEEELTRSERRKGWAASAETAATCPAGCYLLLGDNSPLSWDGRMWGFVPAENLRGRPLLVAFPPWRWHVVR